jgi:hypothetical protein
VWEGVGGHAASFKSSGVLYKETSKEKDRRRPKTKIILYNMKKVS